MVAVVEPQTSINRTAYTDEELIGAYHAGEPWMRLDDLFQELVRRHRTRLLQWCFRYCRDRDEAADLVQEVLLKAFRNLHNFRGDSKFSTWLYVICRNHCLNNAAKPARQSGWVDQAAAESLPDHSARSALSWMERQQERHHLWRTIDAVLTPTEARVMVMHFADELPLAAVSKELGLTNRSGAKAYIVSARRKLDLVLRQRRTPPSRRQA